MAAQTGPRLTIAGTCEGCAWLRPSTVGGARLGFVDCTHPARPVPFIGNVNTSITTPDGCPELPAARLALARSICNHCGADIAPDYLGLYAKPTCEKCANERTGDTTDECSAARGAGESE